VDDGGVSRIHPGNATAQWWVQQMDGTRSTKSNAAAKLAATARKMIPPQTQKYTC
jgi:hypothetical protein